MSDNMDDFPIMPKAHLRVGLAEILLWEPKGRAIKRGLRRLNWVLTLREMGTLDRDQFALYDTRFTWRLALLETLAYISFILWRLHADTTKNYITIREYLHWALGLKPKSDAMDQVILLLADYLWLDEFGFEDPVLSQTQRWRYCESFTMPR